MLVLGAVTNHLLLELPVFGLFVKFEVFWTEIINPIGLSLASFALARSRDLDQIVSSVSAKHHSLLRGCLSAGDFCLRSGRNGF